MPRPFAFLAALLILLSATTAIADRPAQLVQSSTAVERVFSDLERSIIREVLGAAGVKADTRDRTGGKTAKGAKGAPPGLAKRDRLPPGLQRQLERNGRLPPGLEKRQFPTALRIQLPPPRPGTERVIIGNDAVLIEQATNIVLDIIQDVVVNRN